ncbi:hypothetical protein [Agaribacter flavus]|uniref:Lipoprotein n=1 Tax=Agaribacter flavus TaxID=1902781 RepID=A0ABV7FU92_9ALTE
MKVLVKTHANKLVIVSMCILGLQACMSKEAVNNEHQLRMQRCEQYVGMAQINCLKGQNVTIDEYKDDYREFKKDQKQKEADEAPKIKPLLETDKDGQ